MSVIHGSPATSFVTETYLEHIDKVLFVAGEYGGKAFGNFIRNTVIPRGENPLCNVSFCVISLWFTTENLSKLFVEHMQTKLRLNSSFREAPAPRDMIVLYGVSVERFNLSVHGTYIASFDIIIGEIFPVNDFNVNCLTYLCRKDYSTGEKKITRQLKAEKGDRNQLITDIHNKEATLSASYAEKAVASGDHLDRINILIRADWTIKLGELRLMSPINKEQLIHILESNRKPVKDSTAENQEATIPQSYAEQAVKDEAFLERINMLIRLGWIVKIGETRFANTISKHQLSNILDSTKTPVTPLTFAEAEARAYKSLQGSTVTPKVVKPSSPSDTLEDLIRNNPLFKDAIANLLTKMISESTKGT